MNRRTVLGFLSSLFIPFKLSSGNHNSFDTSKSYIISEIEKALPNEWIDVQVTYVDNISVTRRILDNGYQHFCGILCSNNRNKELLVPILEYKTLDQIVKDAIICYKDSIKDRSKFQWQFVSLDNIQIFLNTDNKACGIVVSEDIWYPTHWRVANLKC